MLRLDGKSTRFTSEVGVDDNAAPPATPSVEFVIYGDGKLLWASGICKHGQKPKACSVDTFGVNYLELVVTDAGDGKTADHANWGVPRLSYAGSPPLAGLSIPAKQEEFILTPPAPKSPRINAFELQFRKDGQWVTQYMGSMIGHAKKIDFSVPVTCEAMRLVVTEASAPPRIAHLAASLRSSAKLRPVYQP